MTRCEYCYEDIDGFVTPIEKNCHAFIYNKALIIKANGWRKSVPINFCPMCGRKLREPPKEETLMRMNSCEAICSG